MNTLERMEDALEIIRRAPTENEVIAMINEAVERGCGMSMKKGRPSTLRVNPVVPAGTMIIVDPAALTYPNEETP